MKLIRRRSRARHSYTVGNRALLLSTLIISVGNFVALVYGLAQIFKHLKP